MHQEQEPAKVVSASRPGVLLIGNFLSATRGTRGVCEDLAMGLRAAGWSVITTSSCPSRFARLVDFLVTVWRQRNRYKVAQVDVYSGPSFLWAELVCWALRSVKKPYVLTLHGGNLPAFAKRHSKRVQHLLQTACAVTTPSSYLFEQMRVYRRDLMRLPNSLELNKYTFKQRDRPAPNLVWLRAFHDIYNPSLAVKVVALLGEDFPTVRLVMIGPDKKDGSLQSAKNLAVKLGVLERITFTGPVAKATTPEWINGGDILLNTPRIDNTPVSILEAMACGVCIVSTNVGGIPYLLEDEHDALLVQNDDDSKMAKAVQRFLTEDGLAERLSMNARRKVEQCDWSMILPKWEQLFLNIIRREAPYE
ncbi:MAG: glycosyltransferase family 4 protein [Nitrospira sp.]|nr:glycosyltransferase family 4 protein [Nitrospira sp.]